MAQSIRISTTPPKNYVPSGRNADPAVTEKVLSDVIEFLTSEKCAGRGTGSDGANTAAMFISQKFSDCGLVPVNGSWSHAFPVNAERVKGTGRNIMGVYVGANAPKNTRYVIVGAHYDNLGVLEGKMYPGADSNASGVAAMFSIIDMLQVMKDLGRTYSKNILFVAFDGKEANSSGAEYLLKQIEKGELMDPTTGQPITKDRIYAMANIDIIGSTLAPLKSGREDFIMMLSGGQFVSQLTSANNQNPDLGLELGFDYYGSKNFTRMFYNRIGDQKVFVDAGIPAVLFTSGITMQINKETDKVETLNLPILKKRTQLIFHWLEKML